MMPFTVMHGKPFTLKAKGQHFGPDEAKKSTFKISLTSPGPPLLNLQVLAVRGQSVGSPWAGSVEWRRPAEEGGGGKPPLECAWNLCSCLARRQGAADLMATPAFHRPLMEA